jgi:hypothetical protein
MQKESKSEKRARNLLQGFNIYPHVIAMCCTHAKSVTNQLWHDFGMFDGLDTQSFEYFDLKPLCAKLFYNKNIVRSTLQEVNIEV